MTTKNLCGKMRPKENPYEIWMGLGMYIGFEYRVLKKWSSPEGEAKNQFARWFLATKSPYLPNGTFELGDGYAAAIKKQAYKLTDQQMAEHLKI